MRQRRAPFDRIATLAALRLLAWVARRIEPEQQLWLEALRAELDAIDGGIARFLWATGGLRLVWFGWGRHMVNATYHAGPVLLLWLEGAVFVGLTWSSIQQYGSLAVILLVLAGLGLVVALPVLIALVHALRARATKKWVALHEPEYRVRPPLPCVLSIISLATLLMLWLSAPMALNQLLAKQGLATAGVVVSSADHHTAEAVFDQTGSLSHADVYLTTQVKPVTVHRSSTVPWPGLSRSPAPPQALVGLQGYDLAHGQFPDGAGMGFSPDWGSRGPGPDQILGPAGRLLGAHDAKTLNILIPRDGNGLGSDIYNGSTITVQSLITGEALDLHVVGEYEPDGSATTPLFGKFLASDSVVQALSGGHPSYAYGLHLDGNQIQAVFERLHTSVPAAQLFNFLTGPTGSDTKPAYALFTDPNPASGGGDNNVPPSSLFVAIPSFWAVLFAAIIVLNWETRTLISQSGLGNRRKDGAPSRE